ncbi:SET domain-containing protein-lysine N-methyltransferase [Candidatus Pacearchaeota archaeon]|nr:SET domain-containing protein-lysine N-methyltransferase [Candidatus Pacearchaeota archaeon]
MPKNISIKKSKIEGKGVFASRNFKEGEIVIKWDISRQLTPEEVKELPEAEKKYIAYFKGKYILMKSPAKYVNHSCDANTYVNNFCDIAKRDIKKGEEITSDYSKTMETNDSMKCDCKSKNCKKIIRTNFNNS